MWSGTGRTRGGTWPPRTRQLSPMISQPVCLAGGKHTSMITGGGAWLLGWSDKVFFLFFYFSKQAHCSRSGIF